jgi:hypothetical protein
VNRHRAHPAATSPSGDTFSIGIRSGAARFQAVSAAPGSQDRQMMFLVASNDAI